MKIYNNLFWFLFVFLVFFNISKSKSQGKLLSAKKTIIRGHIRDLKDSAQITVQFIGDIYGAYGNEDVSEPAISNQNVLNSKYSSKETIKNGHFNFEWPKIRIVKDVFLSINNHTGDNGYFSGRFILEPGDSVYISKKKEELYFRGRGSEKYNCEYKLALIEHSPIVASRTEKQKNIRKWFEQLDSLGIESIKVLETYRNKIKPNIFWTIYGSIVSTYQSYKFIQLGANGGNTVGGYRTGEYNIHYLKTLDGYQSPLWTIKIQKKLSSISILNHKLGYLEFLFAQYRFDYNFKVNKPFKLNDCYDYFSKIFDGSVREWVIYRLIQSSLHEGSGQNVAYSINNALNSNYVKNLTIKNYLTSLKYTVPGSIALNFALVDTTGHIVHQSDLRGKIVLLDTWYNHCGPCAKLHPILDSVKNLFSKNDFIVVSIFNNLPPFSNKEEWIQLIAGGKYTSTDNVNLLLDVKKDAVFLEHYKVTGSPTLILIDKEGNILPQPVDPRYDGGKSLVALIKKNL